MKNNNHDHDGDHGMRLLLSLPPPATLDDTPCPTNASKRPFLTFETAGLSVRPPPFDQNRQPTDSSPLGGTLSLAKNVSPRPPLALTNNNWIGATSFSLRIILCLTSAFLGTVGIFAFLPKNMSTLNNMAQTKCSKQTHYNEMQGSKSAALNEDLPWDANEYNKTLPVSISETTTPLFDFAIVGYPKAGTAFLRDYLRSAPEIYMPKTEICSIDDKTTHHDLISRLYDPKELCGKDTTCGVSSAKISYEGMRELHKKKYKEIAAHVKGFKCPSLLERELSFPNAIRFVKPTNMIIQIRHPVLWFESFYNFRSREIYPEALLSPNHLATVCTRYVERGVKHNIRNVCTNRANFHHSLARLGLTPMDTPKERKMLDEKMSVHPINGKVFLLEIGQMSTVNKTRSDQFRHDIQDFLGLKDELPPLPKHNKTIRHTKARVIDICDHEHKKAHDVLLKNGMESTKWIKTYFLKSDRVHVTSKEYFLKLLDQWSIDPCVARREKKNAGDQ
ncbi:hypothetical protein ACHAWF_003038 [Thalassiosira exigua]